MRDPVGAHLMVTHAAATPKVAAQEQSTGRALVRTGEPPAPPVKAKPNKVKSVVEAPNTRRQYVGDLPPGASTSPARAAAEPDYRVAFFGDDNKAYCTPANATIRRAGRLFFLMPLENSGIVKNAGDAARYTGMAPSAQKAYVNRGEINGLSFPLDGMTLTKPTAADARGWAHYLEGGTTAVKTRTVPRLATCSIQRVKSSFPAATRFRQVRCCSNWAKMVTGFH